MENTLITLILHSEKPINVVQTVDLSSLSQDKKSEMVFTIRQMCQEFIEKIENDYFNSPA